MRKGAEMKRKELDSKVTSFAKSVAKVLGLIFGIHGTDEDRFTSMADFYEEMNVNLVCINELIDK